MSTAPALTLQTANVPGQANKLPKGAQAKAKQQLHAIWRSETRAAAEVAFDQFVDAYGAKYVKAAACLVKDREPLLAFYDFPAEHWKHVRTHKSRREHVRDPPPAHHQDQGLPVAPDGADSGVAAGRDLRRDRGER